MVGKTTKLWAGWFGVRIPVGARDFSLSQNVETGSGADQSPVSTAVLSRGKFSAHLLRSTKINPLNAELNPIRHLLALVGARHLVHVSRIGVKKELNDTATSAGQGKLHNVVSLRYEVVNRNFSNT